MTTERVHTFKKPVPLLLFAALLLSVIAAGCGGGGGGGGSVSAASFCSDLKADAGTFQSFAAAAHAYRQGGPPPSKTLIANSASALQKLANEAPVEVQAALQTQASAYSQYGKNGDVTALGSSAFRSANSKTTAWVNANCKA